MVVALPVLLACGLLSGTESPPTSLIGGIAPADSAPPVLEVAWSARVGQLVGALGVHRWVPDGPAVVVALAGREVHTWDLDGRALPTFELPDDAVDVATDPTGRVGGLAITSMTVDHFSKITYAVATDLAFTFRARDGSVVWQLHHPPSGNGPARIAWLERGGRPVLYLDTGDRARLFEPDGRLLADHPTRLYPAWTTGEVTDDGDDDVLVSRPVPGGTEVVALDATFQPGTGWPSERATALAVEDFGGERRVGLLGSRWLVVYGAGGVEVCRAPVDGDGRRFATADLDGDGVRGWVLPARDGTLQLVSADCSARESHATGLALRGLTVHSRPGGDLVVVADERGVRAFRALPGRELTTE